MGKRFNELFMNARRIPKVSIKQAMRQWREQRGLMDSKTEVSSEGSSSTDSRDGGSDDSPIQDGEKPVRGSNRLATGKKRNSQRAKSKNKRTG